MKKDLRFIRMRQLSGVRKAPGPRGTTIWSVYYMPPVAQRLRGKGEVFLGQIYWFGRWKRYSFYPASETVFEQDCLRKIADFCERQTEEIKRRLVQFPYLGMRRDDSRRRQAA